MTGRAAAGLIRAAGTAGAVWAIGVTIRGPQARPSIPRDLGVGALVVAALVASKWAWQQ